MRCSGRGVVESGYGSRDSSGKGGGSGVVRSTDSSRQRLRRRARPRRSDDEEEEIKATVEEGLAAVEVAGKRRREQRGPARAAVDGRKGNGQSLTMHCQGLAGGSGREAREEGITVEWGRGARG
ncbi:hypothetical protein B296_00028362 [Ensete ventricosum]|uniref:Uncharacterized protein n=1 Tax=Ensete ventricosum TaxID=4639 RepID=A0A426Y5N5_ENSVE|nr:hypothetical protein B296_00028362 [Ensete ventricosum]